MFRPLAALSISITLLATSSAAPTPRDRAVPAPRMPDSILLPGEWHETKEVVNRDPKLTFGVGKLQLGGLKGRYRLNERATPKEIDIVLERGPALLGVYSLHGDELTVCYGVDQRPTQLGKAPGAFVMRAVRKK